MAIPWESFLERYRALAQNLAAGIAGRRDEADDVVQEAILALIAAERREPGRFASPEHARNYFLKSVRNLALKRRERGIEHEPLPAIEPAERDDADAERQRARIEALARAADALDPAARSLFESRFRRRATLAEIARESGVPISTLHAREKALLKRLREAIGREDDER